MLHAPGTAWCTEAKPEVWLHRNENVKKGAWTVKWISARCRWVSISTEYIHTCYIFHLCSIKITLVGWFNLTIFLAIKEHLSSSVRYYVYFLTTLYCILLLEQKANCSGHPLLWKKIGEPSLLGRLWRVMNQMKSWSSHVFINFEFLYPSRPI